MKKILILIGTRPEAIKLAPLIKAFEREKTLFSLRVCATGQHLEMADQVFDFFKIKIDSRLNTLKPGQSLSSLTSTLLLAITEEIKNFNADIVIVQGDTATAFTGALAAFYSGCQIGHVEAGLRTFQNRDPFPEEMNRKLISQMADWHFTPTQKAKLNLLNEGLPEEKITVTGNTGIDALHWGLEEIESRAIEEVNLVSQLIPAGEAAFILATVHRRENQGAKLENICEALKWIAEKENRIIVLPVHPNPNISTIIKQQLSCIKNIILTKPLPYPGFLWLMKNCSLIITDSGGIQEEATSIGKQTVLVRETTERTEAVEGGIVIQAGTETMEIVKKTKSLLDKNLQVQGKSIFGDGHAAEKIVDVMKQQL